MRESTLGTLPASPRMRTVRTTGESLNWTPIFFNSMEMRSDRMQADPSKINERNDGGFNFELAYPVALGAKSICFESAMLSSWVQTPERDNDGTADSVITDVATTGGGTVTCTTGATFQVGHLVLQSGFGVAANNGVFRVTTGGATSYACSAASMGTEAAPPATARAKVVGIEGTSGDIVATSTGLTSTTINFVTSGIVVGQWLKIGGTAAGTRYNTNGNNGWARAIAVSANAITLDNRPAGWGADTGTGKTIRIWFGDYVRNGTTLISASIERGFLAQGTPTFLLQTGMCVDTLNLDFVTEQGVTGSVGFLGMTGSQGTSANGNSYAAAPTNTVLTANASVGELRIGGSAAATPNWVRSLSFSSKNSLRQKTAVGTVGAVDIGTGSHDLTGSLETYFGSNSLLASAMAGTVSSLMARAQINSQAFIVTVPRVTFTNATENASGMNQDVILKLDWEASIDTTTNSQWQFDRIEYFES